MTDESGTIQYANPQFARMVGYSVEELIGSPFKETLLDEDSLADPSQSDQNKQDGSQRLEVRLKRKDGTRVDALTFKSPFSTEKGAAKGQLCIHLDVTERKQAIQKLEEEQYQSRLLKSMLLSSRINPQFIYNSLNSVQYLILDNSVEPALNFVSEFSMLIRSVQENASYNYITLKEEIDCVELYLALEKQRYQDRFTFEIMIDPDVEPKELLIPPMLLQPYVENAIIHGIAGIEEKGKVSVCFEDAGEHIKCTIEDNGIGRQEAMERKKMRMGSESPITVQIPDSRLKLLNELENNAFSVYFKDLKDKKGMPLGTKVEIYFPKKTE